MLPSYQLYKSDSQDETFYLFMNFSVEHIIFCLLTLALYK
jgi:hypothetical protein